MTQASKIIQDDSAGVQINVTGASGVMAKFSL